jgi:hypothetical protein
VNEGGFIRMPETLRTGDLPEPAPTAADLEALTRRVALLEDQVGALRDSIAAARSAERTRGRGSGW